MVWLQFSWLEIFGILLFFAHVLWGWAFTTAGCGGCIFTILDAYTRRDEIANTVLLNRANTLLNKAKREAKRYANV